MKYLFDTNICIYLLNKRDERLLRRVSGLPARSAAVSTLSVAELAAGVALTSGMEQDMATLAEFLSSFEIISFELTDAQTYATVYPVVGRTGKKAHAIDSLLAAQAIARNLSLVTNDLKFPRIPGMKILTWA
ncbi:MAG: type II toxin-antitoxin system VapC family toxin [Bacteroidota bacterium]